MSIVHVRFDDEEHDVREFVTPQHHQVRALAKRLGNDLERCYEWVTRNVHYPPVSGLVVDYHRLQSFRRSGLFGGPLMDMSTLEFWRFPAETLGWHDSAGRLYGDCEDSSLLLVSLARNFLGPDEVQVAAGSMRGSGHAWVRFLRGERCYVLETTLERPFPLGSLVEDGVYRLEAYFNDTVAVEVVPGTWKGLGTGPETRRIN